MKVLGLGTEGDGGAAIVEDGRIVADSNAERHHNRKRLLIGGLKLAVSAVVVYWILSTTSIADIMVSVRAAVFSVIVVAFALGLVGSLISVSRWRLLLRATGVHASFLYLIQSFMVGMFFNQFLPSTVGGDAVRAYDSWRLGTGKAHAVVVVFMDRFLGMSALLFFAICAAFVADEITEQVPLLMPLLLAVGAVALAVVIVAVQGSPWLAATARRWFGRSTGEKMARVFGALEAFRGQHKVLAAGFGLSLLLQANVVLQFYLVGASLGLDVAFLDYLLIVPVSLMVMAIPLSVNAIGIRESILAYCLGLYGVARPDAVALAWIAYGIVIVQALIGGLVYTFRR